jgi:hypothetical protein
MSINEAAELLDYSVRGLRKVIDRSRRKLAGMPVRGPTIRFFQAHLKSPIEFKREWIEEFIRDHTHDPNRAPASAVRPPQGRRRPESTRDGTGVVLPGPAFGFDPALYDV